MTTGRPLGVLLFAGGMALFVVGGLAGVWLGEPLGALPEAYAAAGGATSDEELRETVAELARSVESLRAELTMARGGPDLAPLTQDLEALRGDLIELRDGDARVPVGGADGDVVAGALERRLEALEQLVRERLAVPGSGGVAPLRLPMGEPNRFALGRLLEEIRAADGDSSQITARHRLWSYQAIIDRYGAPDDVNVRDNHIEFEYALPELDDNFDFHFVDGFCVLAH